MFYAKKYSELTGLEKSTFLLGGLGPRIYKYIINLLPDIRRSAILDADEKLHYMQNSPICEVYSVFSNYVLNNIKLSHDDKLLFVTFNNYYSGIPSDDSFVELFESFSQEELEEIIDMEPRPEGEQVEWGPVAKTEKAKWEDELSEKVENYCLAHPEVILQFIDKWFIESGL